MKKKKKKKKKKKEMEDAFKGIITGLHTVSEQFSLAHRFWDRGLRSQIRM